MNYKQLIKILIFTQLFFFIVAILASLYPSDDVETFNKFIANKSKISDWLIILLGFIYIILIIFSYIFILKFKKIGRDIYLISTLMGILCEFLLGPTAYSNLEVVSDNIYFLLSGATFAIIYYSPLSKEFS